jgi:hypothetical protein
MAGQTAIVPKAGKLACMNLAGHLTRIHRSSSGPRELDCAARDRHPASDERHRDGLAGDQLGQTPTGSGYRTILSW